MREILIRRSVRKFDLTKKIPLAELEDLCRYGEQAPSARRQKSREYMIIDDQEIINELSKISKGSMLLSECNTVLCIMGKNPNELPTPHMQAQDLSAAVENILIQATSKGYGSCWIGVYPLEDRMNPIRDILGIPNEKFPFCLIALGYPLEPDNCFYEMDKKPEIHYNRY